MVNYPTDNFSSDSKSTVLNAFKMLCSQCFENISNNYFVGFRHPPTILPK